MPGDLGSLESNRTGMCASVGPLLRSGSGALVPPRFGVPRSLAAAAVVPPSAHRCRAVRPQDAAAAHDPRGSVGIFGAGAAGLAAAYFAAQNPDLAVTVYEKTSEVGRKIKVRAWSVSGTERR